MVFATLSEGSHIADVFSSRFSLAFTLSSFLTSLIRTMLLELFLYFYYDYQLSVYIKLYDFIVHYIDAHRGFESASFLRGLLTDDASIITLNQSTVSTAKRLESLL